MTRWLGLLCALLLAAPAWAQTWEDVDVLPRAVSRAYLGGSQSIPQGQPGAAVSVCPRLMYVDGTIFRSYSGAATHQGVYYSFGGGHAGHPGNDLDRFDIAARAWLPQPYDAECPPPYNPDGTPNGTWRQVKGGGVATRGFSPTGKPFVHHTYDLLTVDTRRHRLLFMSGNGLMAWDIATEEWSLLAERDRYAGEVTVGSTGSLVYDEATDRVVIFASDTTNSAARGIYRYAFDESGAVETTARVASWPVLANWSFAYKLITAVRGPGRLVYLMFTPATTTTSTPPNRLMTYHLDTHAVVWDQSFMPGTPAYDGLAAGGGFQTWDRRAATGQLYFWMPGRVWIKTEASGAWTSRATTGGAPGIARWTFTYDAATDTFVGLDPRTLYCGVSAAACGGIADTWVLTP